MDIYRPNRVLSLSGIQSQDTNSRIGFSPVFLFLRQYSILPNILFELS